MSLSGQWTETKSLLANNSLQRHQLHADFRRALGRKKRIEGQRRLHAKAGQQTDQRPADAADANHAQRALAQLAPMKSLRSPQRASRTSRSLVRM